MGGDLTFTGGRLAKFSASGGSPPPHPPLGETLYGDVRFMVCPLCYIYWTHDVDNSSL